MKVIVDTNVPVVANKAAPQASEECIIHCAQRLQDIQRNDVLVLDDDWYILSEYKANLRSEGQRGVGDAFLKWVLTHRNNPLRCEQVSIHPRNGSFAEFPEDAALASFHHKDRKFVAVALAHPEHPPILNAVDTDWWVYREALSRHGVQIQFLCPEMMV
jgi:hypothetical protein